MNNLVEIHHREAITTSLKVAGVFGKRHDRVLESIRHLVPDLPNIRAPFFREAVYADEQGKPRPMYEMTRDGFSLLAMGFTGKKALTFKLQYIQAFNTMERALIQRQNLSWQQQRDEGKAARRVETDIIARFIEYATAQGSQSARLYYVNVTQMTHHALFMVKQASPKPFRDMLDAMQLSFLASAEYIVQEVLTEGMEAGAHYKEIFRVAKERVTQYAATLPQHHLLPA